MYKFLLVLTVATLTACGSAEPAVETTADTTAVVSTDTVTVVADSAVVVDSLAK
jgi:predicted small lipoprotein YifL